MQLLTILFVSDLARAVRFYDSVFEWPKTVDVPVYVEYELNVGARVGLMPQSNTAHFLGRFGEGRYTDESARAELYLSVPQAQEYIERLQIAGASQLSPPVQRDWGDRVGYWRDLDGYVIAIAEPGSGI